MPAPRTALIAALSDELSALLPMLQGAHAERRAGRDFWVGRLGDMDVVAVLSGVGKVAAAVTTTLLLDHYRAGRVLFLGVAGGLGPRVQVGDVVVADALLQHDLDASPLFPRHEVPFTGLARFPTDAAFTAEVARAAQSALGERATATPSPSDSARSEAEPPRAPEVHRGLIVSGDQFISTTAACRALQAALPDALAVEMEGAAVAQVCHAFGAPLAVVRAISDRADDDATRDFARFLRTVAGPLGARIVAQLSAHTTACPTAHPSVAGAGR